MQVVTYVILDPILIFLKILIPFDIPLNAAAFSKFSALQELELPLNNIHNTIEIQPDTFTTLVTLDLSYNRLTGDDILALGLLVDLQTLHLTGMNK